MLRLTGRFRSGDLAVDRFPECDPPPVSHRSHATGQRRAPVPGRAGCRCDEVMCRSHEVGTTAGPGVSLASWNASTYPCLMTGMTMRQAR